MIATELAQNIGREYGLNEIELAKLEKAVFCVLKIEAVRQEIIIVDEDLNAEFNSALSSMSELSLNCFVKVLRLRFIENSTHFQWYLNQCEKTVVADEA